MADIEQTQRRPVLVTGCSSGIGSNLVTTLSDHGFWVIASCRNPRDVTQWQERGFDAVALDLDHSDSIRQAVDETVELTGGSLYGLINNGAYGQPGAVEDLSRDALRQQFETNVFGTQELTNLIIPLMRNQGQGRIVQISSVLGFVCARYRGAYNASKFALEALTDTMRQELHQSGILFSLVEPGPIESDFKKNAYHKFCQHIDAEDSVHREAYEQVASRLTSDQPVRFTLPAEAVSKAVLHALNSRRPRIRYPITLPTRLLSPLKRLLPDWLMDHLLIKG